MTLPTTRSRPPARAAEGPGLARILPFCLLACAHNAPVTPQVAGALRHPRAEIRPHHGAPTLFVNGVPSSGLAYMTYRPQSKYYEAFGNAGVNLASVDVTADFSLSFADQPTAWLGPDRYDFSDIDKKMNLILRANPNAYVFPRVYLCSPPWWDQEHPDQLVKWDDGSTERKIGRKTTLPSWASEEYRRASANNLRRFIEHVRRQPYANRVIGYHLASGMWHEWFYWKTNQNDFQDYSAPAVHAFRKWLEKKYGTNEALRRAWSRGDVSLSTASIPTRAEREATDRYIWRDPVTRRNVIDYYHFYCDNLIDFIELMARTAKEATNGEQLVGVFYGYVLHTDKFQQNNGHHGFHKLLQSPSIDFFTAPSSYAFRDVGTGYSTVQAPTEAVRLHGKYWFDENDYRTHLLPPKAGYGRTDNLRDSEVIQLRELGNVLAHAWGTWWFDMTGGWYDEPQFMDVIKKLNRIGHRSIDFDRSANTEIAVVVDEDSVFYTGMTNALLRPLMYDQILHLGRMGAPFDWVFLEDLEKARAYKFYAFLNAFHVTPAQKRAIGRLRERGAKAFLWLYGAGYAQDSSLDVKGSADLTGIAIKAEDKIGPLFVRMTDAAAAMLPSVTVGVAYGTDKEIGPLLYPDDPDADVLGVLEGSGEGRHVPGLVLKNVGGLDVYYSASPNLPSALLRAMAARAGVHIYNYGDDVVYASRSFLSVHTENAGVRHLRLPKPSDVYDVYADSVVTKNASRFSVDLPARHTVLYFLGAEGEWKRDPRN